MTTLDLLAAELEPAYGLRARALAACFDSFCQHHNRARFNAEVRAIKSGVLFDMAQYRGLK